MQGTFRTSNATQDCSLNNNYIHVQIPELHMEIRFEIPVFQVKHNMAVMLVVRLDIYLYNVQRHGAVTRMGCLEKAGIQKIVKKIESSGPMVCRHRLAISSTDCEGCGGC